MRAVLVWILTGGLPGLPTVSYAEAAWNLMALVSIGFALWARSKWVLVARNLTAATDRGARAVAGLIDWTCRGLIALAVAEMIASTPGLRLPPRPDLGTSDADLLTLVLVPAVSFAISLGVVGLSAYLAWVTRQFEQGRYRGTERRTVLDPTYTGPRRRATDHDDAPVPTRRGVRPRRACTGRSSGRVTLTSTEGKRSERSRSKLVRVQSPSCCSAMQPRIVLPITRGVKAGRGRPV